MQVKSEVSLVFEDGNIEDDFLVVLFFNGIYLCLVKNIGVEQFFLFKGNGQVLKNFIGFYRKKIFFLGKETQREIMFINSFRGFSEVFQFEILKERREEVF